MALLFSPFSSPSHLHFFHSSDLNLSISNSLLLLSSLSRSLFNLISTMTETETCGRITRAAAKRKASMGIEEDRVNKKRVALGELLNVSNVNVLTNLNQKRVTQKPKKSLKAPAKQIKTAPLVIDLDLESDIDSRSDDPQMCGPYVRDIYEYLREMEVIISFNCSVEH